MDAGSGDRIYRGLAVSTWDTWRDDTDDWPDQRFYRDVIDRFGEPVLDLCCATGRLLVTWTREGLDVDGLDASAEMLDVVRAKSAVHGLSEPTLLHQRLEDLTSRRRYRTIVASSSALQLVTNPDDAAAVMARIVRNLEPGGALVGSFGFGWREGEPLDSGWVLLFERTRGDGAVVRSWTRERHRPEEQVWDADQRFEVTRDGDVIASDLQHKRPEGRWYSQDQAVELFSSAGLVDVEVTSGFSHDPATFDERLFCVLGVHPQ